MGNRLMDEVDTKWTRDKGKGDVFRIFCIGCTRETKHTVVASLVGDTGGVSQEFQIIRCNGCENVSFRETLDVEMYEPDENGEPQRLKPRVFLYPQRVSGEVLTSDFVHLPEQIVDIYTETEKALADDMPILAGMGLRLIVEAVCHDRRANGRNLDQRIDRLVEIGLLTQTSAEMLHSLRIIGNASAHQAASHSPDILRTAFVVVDNLLRNVYVLPQTTSKLPGRTNLRIV